MGTPHFGPILVNKGPTCDWVSNDCQSGGVKGRHTIDYRYEDAEKLSKRIAPLRTQFNLPLSFCMLPFYSRHTIDYGVALVSRID